MTSSWLCVLFLFAQTTLLETQQIQFSHGWSPGFGIGKRNPPLPAHSHNIPLSSGNPPSFFSPSFPFSSCTTIPFSAYFSSRSSSCRHSSTSCYCSSSSLVSRKRATYGGCRLMLSALLRNCRQIVHSKSNQVTV